MENLVDYLNDAFGGSSSNDGVLKYFYDQLFSKYNPDITGYTFIFMVPPDLSGYRINKGSNLYNQVDPSSYFGEVGQFITFAGVDFTPPQSQVNTENISSRNGAIPYATEVNESESCSVTYIENSNLDIYMMHHLWVEYIREILEGVIEPAEEYITESSSNFGAIDYAASLYIVKYRPDMQTITFAAKCMGIFPQGIPSKELIGSRTSNELATLPFTYFCTAYRETTSMEYDNWILSEVQMLASKFSSSWQSVLGLNSLFSPITDALGVVSNMVGTASNIIGSAMGAASGIIGSAMGAANAVIGQASSVTKFANQAAQTVNSASNIVNSARATVVNGLGTVNSAISSFPKKLF